MKPRKNMLLRFIGEEQLELYDYVEALAAKQYGYNKSLTIRKIIKDHQSYG